jgi:hypothetical protein
MDEEEERVGNNIDRNIGDNPTMASITWENALRLSSS